MPQFTLLPGLKDKIRDFGKENLEEMLHALATGIMDTAPGCTVRIYLEDLTKGALACAYASGPQQADIRGTTFPIIASDILVSTTFVSQLPLEGCIGLGEGFGQVAQIMGLTKLITTVG